MISTMTELAVNKKLHPLCGWWKQIASLAFSFSFFLLSKKLIYIAKGAQSMYTGTIYENTQKQTY